MQLWLALFAAAADSTKACHFRHPPSCPCSRPGIHTVSTPASTSVQVLEALEDIAFRPEFQLNRIEKERKAVLAEAQMMNTIEYRVDCQLLQYLHEENNLGCRFPIGKTDQVGQGEGAAGKGGLGVGSVEGSTAEAGVCACVDAWTGSHCSRGEAAILRGGTFSSIPGMRSHMRLVPRTCVWGPACAVLWKPARLSCQLAVPLCAHGGSCHSVLPDMTAAMVSSASPRPCMIYDTDTACSAHGITCPTYDMHMHVCPVDSSICHVLDVFRGNASPHRFHPQQCTGLHEHMLSFEPPVASY
eukprot:351819-Chlamydomonas_euryale.AAC.2